MRASPLLATLRNLTANKRLSKREIVLASAFLMLLIGFLYYYLVLAQQLQTLQSLKAQLTRQEKLLQDMRRKNYSNISEMEQKIKDYNRMIAGIYELVPNIKDTPGILVDFYYLLNINRLTSENISLGQLTPQKEYSTFTLGLKVKGAAADVQNFLRSIEKYKRAVNINKLDFSPTEEGLLETDVGLTVYVMHDVVPDPVDYPFMEGRNGGKNPFELFMYHQPEDVEGGGAPITGSMEDIMNLFLNRGITVENNAQFPLTPDASLPGASGIIPPASTAKPQGQAPAGSIAPPSSRSSGASPLASTAKHKGQAPAGSITPPTTPRSSGTSPPASTAKPQGQAPAGSIAPPSQG